MKRPGVSDENFERVSRYGSAGDSFDDNLSELLEMAPPPEGEMRLAAPAENVENRGLASKLAETAIEHFRGDD